MTMNEHRAKIKKAIPRRGAPRREAAPLDERGQIVGQTDIFDALADTDPKTVSRRDDPHTSKAAAAAIAYRTGTQKAAILKLYGQAQEDGLTDEEVASFLGWVEVNKARKRCSDLRNEDMIEPVNDGSVTRVGKSGMANLVCVITTRGVATLASMKEPNGSGPSTTRPVPTHQHVGPTSAGCPACGEDVQHTCHHSGLDYDDACEACNHERSTGR